MRRGSGFKSDGYAVEIKHRPNFFSPKGRNTAAQLAIEERAEVDKKRGCLESGVGSVGHRVHIQEVIPNEE
jgi:hypothetical protein